MGKQKENKNEQKKEDLQDSYKKAAAKTKSDIKKTQENKEKDAVRKAQADKGGRCCREEQCRTCCKERREGTKDCSEANERCQGKTRQAKREEEEATDC